MGILLGGITLGCNCSTLCRSTVIIHTRMLQCTNINNSVHIYIRLCTLADTKKDEKEEEGEREKLYSSCGTYLYFAGHYQEKRKILSPSTCHEKRDSIFVTINLASFKVTTYCCRFFKVITFIINI